jgi:hypothetical protein
LFTPELDAASERVRAGAPE